VTTPDLELEYEAFASDLFAAAHQMKALAQAHRVISSPRHRAEMVTHHENMAKDYARRAQEMREAARRDDRLLEAVS
jgi:hypothetical protein